MKLQIKIDGETYEAEVEVMDEAEGQPGFAPEVSSPATSQPAPAPGAYVPAQTTILTSAAEKQYCSPVTGLVIKVNVKPGQQVEPNDAIIVLEAMKMETSIAAHHAGKVKSVNVAPGDPVKLHQVLIELD